MGRVKMPWGKLEIGAQKEISLGLVRCLQSERNLYYNSINNNMNRKEIKYKTQYNRNYNRNNNNSQIIKNDKKNFTIERTYALECNVAVLITGTPGITLTAVLYNSNTRTLSGIVANSIRILIYVRRRSK